MTQKKTKPTVAVIGLGTIGKIVATNLVNGGRSVVLADRNAAKAEALADQLGSLATPVSVAEAVEEADIVIPAVYFQVMKEMLGQYGQALKGKIIVDVSNPIAPDGKGGFSKIIGEKESAGQLIAALLPAGARLAKAFGTLSSGSLAGGAFRRPERAVLFYAADDRGIDGAMEELIRDSGFEPLLIGGLDQSIRIEVFGDLHEFGALGRLVSLAEAEARLAGTVVGG